MPRKRPGSSYAAPQRTDQLNAAQAPTAPTGMVYGEHQASIDAQGAMPLPDNTIQMDPMARAIEQIGQYQPGNTGLGAETEFPDEPVTTGLDVGPGMGSSVLQMDPIGRVQQTLELIAAATGDPDIARLASLAQLRRR